MTCREVTEFLLDYLDGLMPAPLRDDFERHLSVCSNCRTYLAQYERTIREAHAAFARGDETAFEMPEDLTKAIVAALK